MLTGLIRRGQRAIQYYTNLSGRLVVARPLLLGQRPGLLLLDDAALDDGGVDACNVGVRTFP